MLYFGIISYKCKNNHLHPNNRGDSITAGRLQLRKSENSSVDTGRQIRLLSFVAVCIFLELDALTVVCDLESGRSFHIVEPGENVLGFIGRNGKTVGGWAIRIGVSWVSGSSI